MSDPDRRTTLADAAITLLGTAGAKGLTHRAVDAQAGLPEGSTSFYCRTRQELLALALQRHAQLDLQDLQGDAAQLGEAELTQARFVETLLGRIADWASPAKLPRLAARFELILMASRDPALAATMAQQRAHFVEATELALRRLGSGQPKDVAPRLVAVVDGILIDQVHTPGQPLLSREQQRALLENVLAR